MRNAIIASFSVAAVTGEWTYTWPYTSTGDCQCKEQKGFINFTSESACLESFAANDNEFCRFNGQGINEDNCLDSVSIKEGVTNGGCSSKCTALVVGAETLAEYESVCAFETAVDAGNGIVTTPVGSCFSNRVYGWSDYDASNANQVEPLQIFEEVPSAAKCQELCQNIDECEFFSWRGSSGLTDGSTFQNDVETCLLYDDAYLTAVLKTDITSISESTAFCNIAAVQTCRNDYASGLVFAPLAPFDCLLCGCEAKCAFQSIHHLTGPAFCQPEMPTQECGFARPTWTSTRPPCEVVTAPTSAPPAVTETSTTQGEEGTPEVSTEPASTEAGTTELEVSTSEAPSTSTVEIETSSSIEIVTESTVELELKTTEPAIGTEVGGTLTLPPVEETKSCDFCEEADKEDNTEDECLRGDCGGEEED